MNTAVTVAREQYAERIRSMIWNDMVAGRVPTTVAGFSALGEHVDVNDYLLRAALPAGDPAAVGTWVAGVVDLVDEWIRTDVVRLRYGAFTPSDVSLLTDYLQGVARSQHDVEILARIAGEWLAGLHATISAEEYSHDHSRALRALAHDVLAR